MSHLFVSYSRKNLTFVTQLVKDLQQAGLPVWFDQISIQPGDNWEAAIEKGLKEAIAVAVVVSPESMASEYVRKEINFAQESDQLILPVLYQPAQLFLNLQTIQWVDLSSEAVYAANLQKLITVLRREPGLSADAAPPADESADDTRKLSPATLGNYIHVGALIAGQKKSGWRRLAGSFATASQMNGGGQATALALSRLNPPTPNRLAALLATTPSIQVLHLICRTENDVFWVEDEQGLERALPIDELARILQSSAVKLLVLNGQAGGVQKLLEQSVLQAVITTQASDVACKLFEEHFYAALASGKTIQEGYQTALNSLGAGDEAFFQLAAKHDAVRLTYPPIEKRAIHPIIDPGLPPLRNVPINPDFVGQTQPLLELGEKLTDTRQVMIYGLGGIGKSWLASEFVARYGWRFPDGIVWTQVSEQTRTSDIFNQLRLLLELPLNTPLTDLENILRQRQVLVALDQVNEWGNATELAELAGFVSRLEPLGGTRVMFTSWGPMQALAEVSGARELTLVEMQPADAVELARQLLIDYDLAAEFENKSAIQQLIEKTTYTPWLIKEAIRLARLEGLDVVLEDLDGLTADTTQLFERYVGAQFQKLPEASQTFLRRLQGLPDSFDRRLAQAIESQSREHLRTLIQYQLLRREDKLYTIPPTVRVYLRQRYPLSEAEQDTLDQQVIHYWLRAGGAK